MSFLTDLEQLSTADSIDKPTMLKTIDELIAQTDFHVEERNVDKQWGAYWRFSNEQIKEFIPLFFTDLADEIDTSHELSPKILLAVPRQRLSWQYHHRRSEYWRSINGPAAVCKNETDAEVEPFDFKNGQTVFLPVETRHRLLSQSGWSIVAEIWQHEDAQQPSDESDIVRVQDDYSR